MSKGKAEKGSQRDIQLLFNNPVNREMLQQKLLKLKKKVRIKNWLSPMYDDDFYEYHDEGFMEKVGLGDFSDRLVGGFWPTKGPVWDGLATADDGTILLFEAKAHISELFGIGMKAKSKESRDTALSALAATARYINADYDPDAWTDSMYQTANRLAHLYFLNHEIHKNKGDVKARLIYLIFLDDTTVQSEGETQKVWETAINVAERYILKLPFGRKAKFSDGSDGSWKDWIDHVYISVNDMKM